MKNMHSTAIVNQPGRPVSWETAVEPGSEPLEVNVIFTDPEATAAALKSAETLARGLGARICLRAAIAVPPRLSIDQAPISIRFMEQQLGKLAEQAQSGGSDVGASLYICRDRVRAISQSLKRNSLVVIGGRKHWWPTDASRLAGALKAQGHRVTFVDSREQLVGSR